MRPKSIVRFELVYWLWLAANLASAVLAWPDTSSDPQMRSVVARMPWFPYAVGGLLLVGAAGIGWAVARRGSAYGRGAVALLALVSAWLIGRNLASGLPATIDGWFTVIAAVLIAVAAVLLFLPDARTWFAVTPAANDEAVP